MLLGKTLRQAREEKGQTISQVAEATRMMTQIIEDLEREDFRRIAAPIYGRGFIKLYAEYLGLDPEPLIREFIEIYTGSRPPSIARRHAEDLPVENGRTVGPSDSETVGPSDRPTVPPSDHPAGEPDLFTIAAGRSEAVRAVADPALPGESAQPPRVHPTPTRRIVRTPAMGESASWRDPAKLREGSETGASQSGRGAGWPPPHWMPAIIGLVAALIILLLLWWVGSALKKGKTGRAKPQPIKVERVLRPTAPYFD